MTSPRLEFLSPSYGMSLEDLQKENELLKDQLAEAESKVNQSMWLEFAVGILMGAIIGTVVTILIAIYHRGI
jgi:hypothetical protein